MAVQLLLLLVSFVLAEGSSCPSAFQEVGPVGCCYYFSADFGHEVDWQEARDSCHELGEIVGKKSDLAEVGRSGNPCCNDLELMDLIRSKGQDTWLGASDSVKEDRWVWQQSQEVLPLTSSTWKEDRPNGGTASNCLLAGPWGSYHSRVYFYDNHCEYNAAFICQIF
ncbi:unnamed protein product [Meganyctiphanes norvegica]|uniref:C-type lectin domain-containing protein n=1 Tax=Meganyctiphanes norvegica TaxID=48144 RepID=A0AAV2S013_MEGNR